MNIGSVSGSSNLADSYKTLSVPSAQVNQAKEPADILRADELSKNRVVVSEANVHEITPEPVLQTRQDAALEDISLTFNRQDDFGYLGKDSDIHSLDVERAISDMRKDQVLQQYQYFVGRSQNLFARSTDGVVLAKF